MFPLLTRLLDQVKRADGQKEKAWAAELTVLALNRDGGGPKNDAAKTAMKLLDCISNVEATALDADMWGQAWPRRGELPLEYRAILAKLRIAPRPCGGTSGLSWRREPEADPHQMRAGRGDLAPRTVRTRRQEWCAASDTWR
jgi:hypothetical protein